MDLTFAQANNILLLEIKRMKSNGITQGVFFIDGIQECYILEDKDRGLRYDMKPEQLTSIKVYGETAIPTSSADGYLVTKIWWEKHQRFTPFVNGVPGYAGIRMHSGVTANDTLGCPLYCEKIISNCADNTTTARIAADQKIFAAIDSGKEVRLIISREYEIALAA